jgi:secondary thiamine-phosphate synthase enzyme
MPMDTVASARTCHHTSLRIATRRATEFVDVTERLDRLVSDSRLDVGVLTLQTRHTTTGLVVNEHEPLLLADFDQLLERAAPRALAYWHDELPLRPGVSADEPRNGHAHCRALLLPSSVVLTVAAGRLQLGRWQRVFLVEFDGPRERELSVVIMGEVLS